MSALISATQSSLKESKSGATTTTDESTRIAMMRGHWDNLALELLGLNQTPALIDVAMSWGNKLITLYSEPHRRYHDLTHIETLLGLMHTLTTPVSSPILISLTTWFHDAIYSTTPGGPAGQNERDSADLFLSFVSDIKTIDSTWAVLSDADVECVYRWIVCTATHIDPERKDLEMDGQLFLDMDLAVLGAESEVYAQYVANIRYEYSSYSDEQFSTGRAAVLKGMLRDDCRLYVTSEMYERYEAQARSNMAEELRELTD